MKQQAEALEKGLKNWKNKLEVNKMFGKDYSKEISELREVIKSIQRQQGEIINIITTFQNQSTFDTESLITIAKVQATHKESIKFLLNHATVDEDAKEDFIKMLRKISEVNDIVKKSNKSKGGKWW